MNNSFTLCPCGNSSPCDEEKCKYNDSQCDEYTYVDIYNETKTHISISFNKDGSNFDVTIDRKCNKITSINPRVCQMLDGHDDIVENKSSSHTATISDILNLIQAYKKQSNDIDIKEQYSLCICTNCNGCPECYYGGCIKCPYSNNYIIDEFIEEDDDEKSSIHMKFKSSLSSSDNNSGEDCKYGDYDVTIYFYPDGDYQIECNNDLCHFGYCCNDDSEPAYILSKTEIDGLSFFMDISIVMSLIDLHDEFSSSHN
jgi:hypothetical protein